MWGLGLFPVLLLAPYLFSWPTPLIFPTSELGTDLPREVWPLAIWIKNALAISGEIPLWRPYTLSGAPLIGHPVAPLLYPPHWLVLILPVALALNILAALHLAWAALGVYLLLRSERPSLHPYVAALCATLFAHTPKWLAHLAGGHWPTLAAIVWWPWALWALLRFWRTGQWRWSLVLAVALAAQALNHGTYFVLGGLWLGAVTLIFLLHQRHWPQLVRAGLMWGGVGVLVLGLAAGQLWPLAELLPFSNRAALTPAEAAFGSLPPILLLNLFFPSELQFPEWFVYPGAGLVLLSVYGWATGWARSERLWAGVALLGLLMSLGVNTPLYSLLYQAVPGLSLFRTPTRWWLLTLLALAVLAAHGFEQWRLGSKLHPVRGRWATAVLGIFYALAGGVKLLMPAVLPFAVWPTTLIVTVGGGLLLWPATARRGVVLASVFLLELLWVSGTLLRPMPEAALLASENLVAPLRQAALNGERSLAPYGGVPVASLVSENLLAADGYDPFPTATYADFVRRAVGCDYAGYVVAVPPTQASVEATQACPTVQPELKLLYLLNVRYLILPTTRPWLGAEPVVTADELQIYDLGLGAGRAFGVAQWQKTTPENCLADLLKIDVKVTALVETELPASELTGAPQVFSHAASTNSETFVVEAPRSGLLILTMPWLPGWRARVNGQPAQLLRVNCALQGVWVPAGAQTVQFEYLPLGLEWGRWLSLATALLVAGAVFVQFTRRN